MSRREDHHLDRTRRVVRTLGAVALVTLGAVLGGCAASADSTWVHPDAGALPPDVSPAEGR